MRYSQITGTLSGQQKNYASSLSYTAHGAAASMTLGNTLVEQTAFNNRLQPLQIKLGTTANPSSVLELDYGYGTTNNNGNVAESANNRWRLTRNGCDSELCV